MKRKGKKFKKGSSSLNKLSLFQKRKVDLIDLAHYQLKMRQQLITKILVY